MKISAAAIVMSIVCAVPAQAQDGPTLDPDLSRVVAASAFTTANPCGDGAALKQELGGRAANDQRFAIAFANIDLVCGIKRQDYVAAATALKKVERMGGRAHPLISLGLAVQLGDANAVTARLNQFIQPPYGADLSVIEPRLYGYAMQILRRAGRTKDMRKLALRWLDSPNFQYLQPELRSGMAVTGVEEVARTGARRDRLPELLSTIHHPTHFTKMLAMREYEQIWPQIEERVGPNYGWITGDYVDVARRQMEGRPNDPNSFNDYVTALFFDGQSEQAIAIASDWREREGSARPLEEGRAWAINIEVFALDSLGRRAEGDALFDWLVATAPKDNSWLINFWINRASRLVGDGQWERGLAAAAEARVAAARNGASTYGKMLIARNHACALHGLGREKEAEQELPYLREHSSTQASPAIAALMCLNRDDEAAAVMLSALRDKDMRGFYAADWQDDHFDLFYTASKLRTPADLLAARPELQVAVNSFARAIPERFFPQASLRRK